MAFFAVTIIAFSVYFLSSKKFVANTTLKLLSIAMIVIFVYSFYRFFKKINTDEPVMVLTGRAIELSSKNGPVIIPWDDIESFDIETDDGNQSLVLITKTGKEKVRLNWLTKSPKQIEELINEYHVNAKR